MRGSGFLKVTGILMIIGGGISVIFGLIALIGAIAIAAEGSVGSAVGAALIIGTIIGLAGGVLELIAGIIGVKNSQRPDKATTCLVWGIIVLVLQILSIILTIGNAGAGTVILTIIFGLAVPILYIVGAVLNKKSA